MKTITVVETKYLHVERDGSRHLWSSDMSKNLAFGACLGPVECTITYTDLDVDPRQAMIDSLEKLITKEKGESQHKVNLLLDRIGKLKAIGHEVAA